MRRGGYAIAPFRSHSAPVQEAFSIKSEGLLAFLHLPARMGIIRVMGKTKNNPIEDIKDAALGYTALILSVLVFLVLLWLIIAAVRIVSLVG